MIFVSIIKQIWKGHSLVRALMNESFRGKYIWGKTVDVGGGRKPDYFNFFNIGESFNIELVDKSIQKIDFEIDVLPYETNSIDSVLCCNVLEHIYNYQHLVSEIFRILKPKSRLVGFVPFLVQYHPDPHDYFRYTEESLRKILEDAGFREVQVELVGLGLIGLVFNVLISPVPKFLKVPLFIMAYPLAHLSIYIKPSLKKRFPLGYTFLASKY